MDKLKKFYKKNKHLFIVDLTLILFGFCYYLFFANRGVVLSDEGYYVHFAERIANGEIPYKDFALQYTPGYFYLLAFFYKIFGVQILVGRFISLIFCMLILCGVVSLLYAYKIKSIKVHGLALLVMIALGYPLLHIPLIIWTCVFITILLQLVYLQWLRTQQLRHIVSLAVLLGLVLLFRHSHGFAFLFLINGILFLSSKKNVLFKLKILFLLNSVWLLVTSSWVVYFFVFASQFLGLFIIFEFSRQFAATFPFSYPSLTMLSQSTGFFKLLPYYFPVVYTFFILKKLITKKIDWEKVSLALLTLCGFFTTVYPASDLLHVYPFLGLMLVSAIILFYKKKWYTIIALLISIFILLGFYLTFFTKSFRYEAYFLRENFPLDTPKTKSILIDDSDYSASNIVPVYNFINKHTEKNDYIFVYPFSPLLYTILERQNPSGIVQFILLHAPSSLYPEERVLKEIKEKRVKYVIASGQYIFNDKISKFIQKQKIVFQRGPYIIFELKNENY